MEGFLGLGGEKLYYGMAPAKPCTAKGGINLCGLEAVPCQMPVPLGAPDTLLLHLKTKARIAHSKELHTIPSNGGPPLGSVKLICVRGHNEERLQDRSLGAAEFELRENMLRFVDEARIETAWLPIQLKPERVSAMHTTSGTAGRGGPSGSGCPGAAKRELNGLPGSPGHHSGLRGSLHAVGIRFDVTTYQDLQTMDTCRRKPRNRRCWR